MRVTRHTVPTASDNDRRSHSWAFLGAQESLTKRADLFATAEQVALPKNRPRKCAPHRSHVCARVAYSRCNATDADTCQRPRTRRTWLTRSGRGIEPLSTHKLHWPACRPYVTCSFRATNVPVPGHSRLLKVAHEVHFVPLTGASRLPLNLPSASSGLLHERRIAFRRM
jgi:hypothetical protein